MKFTYLSAQQLEKKYKRKRLQMTTKTRGIL